MWCKLVGADERGGRPLDGKNFHLHPPPVVSFVGMRKVWFMAGLQVAITAETRSPHFFLDKSNPGHSFMTTNSYMYIIMVIIYNINQEHYSSMYDCTSIYA